MVNGKYLHTTDYRHGYDKIFTTDEHRLTQILKKIKNLSLVLK